MPRPRPQPRQIRAEDRLLPTEMDQTEQEAAVENHAGLEHSTPKARPRPKATYRTKSPMKSPVKTTAPDINGLTTPVSRKRTRLEDGGISEESPTADQGVESVGADLPLSREPTPTSDIQIRRKRVRH